MNTPTWNDEQVFGFGMALGGPAKVLRPTTVEQIADAFTKVKKDGGSVALRGAGCRVLTRQLRAPMARADHPLGDEDRSRPPGLGVTRHRRDPSDRAWAAPAAAR